MACVHCTDENGVVLLPREGLRPTNAWFGFTTDSRLPMCGTQWCWNCGEGRPQEEGAESLDSIRDKSTVAILKSMESAYQRADQSHREWMQMSRRCLDLEAKIRILEEESKACHVD